MQLDSDPEDYGSPIPWTADMEAAVHEEEQKWSEFKCTQPHFASTL